MISHNNSQQIQQQQAIGFQRAKESSAASIQTEYIIKQGTTITKIQRNIHFTKCLKKYPNCFWLQSDRSYRKIQGIFNNISGIILQNFVFIRTLLNSLSVFSDIKFTYLKVLCLEDNKIQSIQIVRDMYMPRIREISLRNNRITSIKSLRKISRQIDNSKYKCEPGKMQNYQLTKISLDGNKIIDVSDLSKCEIQLQSLLLDVATYDNPCGLDLRCTAKFNFTTSAKVLTQSLFRLEQNLFNQVFARKIQGSQ